MSFLFDGLNQYRSGWRRDRENIGSLVASAAPFVCATVAGEEVPDEINHRGWLRVEDQSSMSSCAGHAISSALEVCDFIQSGGWRSGSRQSSPHVQLSRMFAYLAGQRECGLIGADQGCTIEWVVQAAKKAGACLEATFPYPARYATDIPPAASAEAAGHTIRSHTVLRSYDDCFRFLSAGLGAIIAGVRWVESLAETRGIVERLTGRLQGYHAVPLVGYSRRTDAQERKYLDLPNSWGRRWGAGGWAEVAPGVVEQWFTEDAVVIGVSDLEAFSPRRIPSWKGALSS